MSHKFSLPLVRIRMLTSPSFLLDNAANADLSVILLEVIHSMLQYQMDGMSLLTLRSVLGRPALALRQTLLLVA